MKKTAYGLILFGLIAGPLDAESAQQKAKRLYYLSITQNPKERLETRRVIARLAPNSGYGLFARAYVTDLDGGHRMTKVLRLYSEAIEKNPRLAMAFNNRGANYASIGMRRRALKDFASAIALEKFNKFFIRTRADVLISWSMHGEALKDYHQLVILDPRNTGGYKGHACYWIGAMRAAYKPAEKVFDEKCAYLFKK